MTMDFSAIKISEVATCNLPASAAIVALACLNPSKVLKSDFSQYPATVTTKEHPSRMLFPQGWYFAKGAVRNKHNSTTGLYDEVTALDENGSMWEGAEIAVENQRQCEAKDFSQEALMRTICALNPTIKAMSPLALRLNRKLGNDTILIVEGGYIERMNDCIHLMYGTKSVDIFY